MMDEQEFKQHVNQSMDELYRALSKAADDFDFDPEMDGGALKIEFEDPPARFVVSPNAPVQQIWLSAHSRSFKLDWDASQNSFIHPESGQSLTELVSEQISKQLGDEVTL